MDMERKRSDLISLASELINTFPNPSEQEKEDVSLWQARLEGLCKVCVEGSKLSDDLAELLPLREQGPFLKSILWLLEYPVKNVVTSGDAASNIQSHLLNVATLLKDTRSVSWIEEREDDVDDKFPITRRKGFEKDVVVACEEASRSRSLAMLFVDLDHFKKVNDIQGHERGDDILRNFVVLLKQIVEDKGKSYRDGGDEFTVLLPNNSLDEACAVAERIRQTVEDADITVEQHRITTSIGVAVYPNEAGSWKSLYKLADERMYIAKNHGGNQVFSQQSGDEKVESALPPLMDTIIVSETERFQEWLPNELSWRKKRLPDTYLEGILFLPEQPIRIEEVISRFVGVTSPPILCRIHHEPEWNATVRVSLHTWSGLALFHGAVGYGGGSPHHLRDLLRKCDWGWSYQLDDLLFKEHEFSDERWIAILNVEARVKVYHPDSPDIDKFRVPVSVEEALYFYEHAWKNWIEPDDIIAEENTLPFRK
jgi:diguanylate cyclase (GGDEF)-like protein